MTCEGKVHKVEKILSTWGDKRFNLTCKIALMKALAASPLVYTLYVMLLFFNFFGITRGIMSSGLKGWYIMIKLTR